MPMYWALYEQQGSRWTLQAHEMELSMGSITLKPDQLQVQGPHTIQWVTGSGRRSGGGNGNNVLVAAREGVRVLGHCIYRDIYTPDIIWVIKVKWQEYHRSVLGSFTKGLTHKP